MSMQAVFAPIRRGFRILPGVCLAAGLAPAPAATEAGAASLASQPPPAAARARVVDSFGRLPLVFIENRGQVDERVAYYLQGRDQSVYFTSHGLTFLLHGERPERWALRLDFLGANPNVRPRGEEATPAVVSYFKGHPSRWQTGLPTWSRLVYPDLWPGIDLVYSGTVNRMKYTFRVRPGADPRQIRMAYRGASELTLDPTGELVVVTPLGSLRDERPVSYQEKAGRQVEVATAYRVEPPGGAGEHVYGFELGDHDANLPLVIDPAVLIYAGYLGGSGPGSDAAFGIDVDSAGNAYVTGTTGSTEASFPDGDGFGALGGPDGTFNGVLDAFVVKVNAAGSALLYAGYLGGSGFDIAGGIAVDGAGNAYITGETSSTEASFPDGDGFGALGGPDGTFNGGADAFVAKVDATGSALLYAGYIGGIGLDVGNGIAVDSAGNAYVTGQTTSTEASFPDGDGLGGLGGPDGTFNGGNSDAFVAKVNAAGALVYAGYIGGSGGAEFGSGIAVDGTGNAYVTGEITSTEASFPDGDGLGGLGGPDGTFNGGGGDAFVAKVNPAGSVLLYAGFLGGSGGEFGSGIAVDGAGNAYVTGVTSSTEASFPDGDGLGGLGGPDGTYNGGIDAFVAKVNAAGSALLYAGYIGGSGSDLGRGIAVDGAGIAYVTGDTSSTEASFPDGDGLGALSGPDGTYNGGGDAFVAKVSPAGSALLYAGYIGGSGPDIGFGIALDGAGNAYVTGDTSSTEASFPDGDGLGALSGPDGTYNGSGDGFVAKIADLGIGEIPTLTGTGMVVLALCLACLALGMLRRLH